MASKTETILIALFNRLYRINCAVERNSDVPTEIPANGLIVMHDGEPGEPDIMLSPLTYMYDHGVELDVFVQGDEADYLFDQLRSAIGAVIASDRTLGGLCDWMEPQAPRINHLPMPGVGKTKMATIRVVVTYATSDPLI